MVIIDLHCIKPYVSFCLKTCVKFIDENVSQLWERNVKLTCMHCGIASASQHVFGGKDAFEGWIKAGTLIFHFSSLQASVTQLGFFVMKHGLLIKKKNVMMASWKLSSFSWPSCKAKVFQSIFWSFCFKLRLLLGLLHVSFNGYCLKLIFSCEHY